MNQGSTPSHLATVLMAASLFVLTGACSGCVKESSEAPSAVRVRPKKPSPVHGKERRPAAVSVKQDQPAAAPVKPDRPVTVPVVPDKPVPHPVEPAPEGKTDAPAAAIHPGLRCLLKAYPKQICSVKKNTLIWCDGTKMTYDDGRKKPDFDALLNQADLRDQMSMRYPAGKKYPVPLPKNFDPGRVRYEPFFRKMYGNSLRAVYRKTRVIRWMPKSVNRKVRITTVNGVDRKLEAVSRDLEKLEPGLHKYVNKLGGTLNWRTISGTKRLSMHSFAIAIDINLKYSNYWKWARRKRGQGVRYRNRVPMEIVEVFERHGFIWGGKWYHYDTMHFEYRPEYLQPGCVDRRGKALRLGAK